MCSPPVQKESNFNLSDPISMKKRHDHVSIAIFLWAQTFIKIYFTELYYMSFFKLLYSWENEDGSWWPCLCVWMKCVFLECTVWSNDICKCLVRSCSFLIEHNINSSVSVSLPTLWTPFPSALLWLWPLLYWFLLVLQKFFISVVESHVSCLYFHPSPGSSVHEADHKLVITSSKFTGIVFMFKNLSVFLYRYVKLQCSTVTHTHTLLNC